MERRPKMLRGLSLSFTAGIIGDACESIPLAASHQVVGRLSLSDIAACLPRVIYVTHRTRQLLWLVIAWLSEIGQLGLDIFHLFAENRGLCK